MARYYRRDSWGRFSSGGGMGISGYRAAKGAAVGRINPRTGRVRTVAPTRRRSNYLVSEVRRAGVKSGTTLVAYPNRRGTKATGYVVHQP